MCSDSLINGMSLDASVCRGVVQEALGSAQDTSIGGGSFFISAKASTKHIVADLQNGGQDGVLCLGADREERSD